MFCTLGGTTKLLKYLNLTHSQTGNPTTREHTSSFNTSIGQRRSDRWVPHTFMDTWDLPQHDRRVFEQINCQDFHSLNHLVLVYQYFPGEFWIKITYAAIGSSPSPHLTNWITWHGTGFREFKLWRHPSLTLWKVRLKIWQSWQRICKCRVDSYNMELDQFMFVHATHRSDCLWPIDMLKDYVRLQVEVKLLGNLSAWLQYKLSEISREVLYKMGEVLDNYT